MSDTARPRRIRGIRSHTRKHATNVARKSGVIVASLMVAFGSAFGSGAFATGGDFSEPTTTVSETIVEENTEKQAQPEETPETESQAPETQKPAPVKNTPEETPVKSEKPAEASKSSKPVKEKPLPSPSASAPGIPDGPQSRAQTRAFPTPAPLPNPALPQKCGLNIALVFDMSNSLSDGDITASKTAGKALVDSLSGTPTRMGVYSFASLAPATGNSNLGSTSLAEAGGASTVTNAINSLQRPPAAQGGTNWDRGLAQIPSGYDMVLFITDGNPTAYGTPGTPGNSDWGTRSDQIDIDKATESANALKSGGAFVTGIGVGNLNLANLQYISGTTANTDYYLVGDYTELAQRLTEIGLRDCAGSVTVKKQVRDLNGDLSAGEGWKFTTSTQKVTPASGTTNADGLLNFKLDDLDWNETRTVDIAETMQDGYELEQQDGKNAVCVDNTKNSAPVPVTNSGDLGFKLDVKGDANQVISCTVINKVKAKPLTVAKTADTSFKSTYDWSISKDVDKTSFTIDDGEANPVANYTVAVTEGAKTDSDHKVTGKITVTNPNPVDVTGVKVTDQLDQENATCSVTGGTNVTVPANGEKKLDYTCTFEGTPAATGKNTAKAVWETGQATAAANYDFAKAKVTEVNKTITVSDTYEGAWDENPTVTWTEAGKKTDFTYERELEGTAGECTTFDNTATIVETEQSDDATTEVCVTKPLTAVKTADGSFTRDYDWKISKNVSESDYKVAPEISVKPEYTVKVEIDKVTDSNIKVTGDISVTNPNEFGEAQEATITDQLFAGETPLDNATCTVEGADAHTVEVEAGQTERVSYECELDEVPTADITNKASVSWADGKSTTAEAPVEFTGTYKDVEAVVTDDKVNLDTAMELGTVKVNTETGEIEGDNTFTYEDVSLEAPEAGLCTEEPYTNTATVTESDSKDTDSDTAEVDICTGTDLEITKLSTYTFDRTYDWSIEKTGSDEQQVFGSAGDVDYTIDYKVVVTAEGYEDHDAKFGGTIEVKNPSTWNTVTATEIVDLPSFEGVTCTVEDTDLTFEPGETKTVGYTCEGMPTEHGEIPAGGTNTATIKWDAEKAYSTNGEVSKTIDVDPEMDEDQYATVTVEDLKAPEGTEFGELNFWDVYNGNDDHSKEYTYTVEGTVPAGTCVDVDNTATLTGIPETSDEYNTKVCAGADLLIEKTADYSYDRVYTWGIDKTGEDDKVVAYKDGKPVEFTLDYLVAVTAVDYQDSNHQVTGTIKVTNPVEWSAVDVNVADELEGFACTVDNDGKATIEAGESAEFTYTCEGTPENLDAVTNTAKVTWDENSIKSENSEATAEAEAEPVADVVTDENVIITDELAPEGTFGEELNWHDVHAMDDHTQQFAYQYTGAVKPGETVIVENVASLNDTPGSSDEWTTEVTGEEPPAAPGEPAEPAKPGEPLPVTGAQVTAMAIGGLLLVMAGVGAYIWSRRRTQES